MCQPVVSVCMITYQHAPYIRQALDGVLMQETNFPIDICLGEDGSTDGTREICLEYAATHPDKIRLFLRDRSNPARQQYRVPFMHNGIETMKSCRGKYIALCEGDDYWTDPLKLQKQVELLEGHAAVAICCHAVSVVDETGYPVTTRYEPQVPGHAGRLAHGALESAFRDIARENFIRTCSVLFRNQHPGVWEHPLFRSLPQGDWPLHLLNARNGAIAYIPETMACYREHGGGVWSSKSQGERTLCHLDAVCRLLLSDAFNEEQRRFLSYGLPYAVDNLTQGDFAGWRGRCLEAVRDCRPGGDASDLLDWLILLGRAERDRQHLEERHEALLSSRPYRIGRSLLAPLRWVRSKGGSQARAPQV